MKPGDFAKVEYTGRLEDGNVFDSTDPKLMEGAKGPAVVVLGAGHLIPGLDRELLTMKPGEEREVEVKPEDGFGKRDSKKIRFFSSSSFRKEEVTPVPGSTVLIDNKLATILSVSAGRVVVDFNHPLAGRRLFYKIKLLDQVTKPKEQVKGLLGFHLGEVPEFEIDLEKKELKIKDVPEPLQKSLEQEIKRYTPFKKVLFISNKG